MATPNAPKGNITVPPKETKDLYLAAALHSEGCKYLGIDRSDPTRMVFRFEGGELADRIETQWYQGTCVGSLSVYSQSVKTMKSLIHNQ